MPAPVGSGRALGVAMSVQEFDQITLSSGGKAGFFGVTAAAQPASAAQAALTLTTVTVGGAGLVTSAGMTALVAQVENMRASLVTLGLLKGGA